MWIAGTFGREHAHILDPASKYDQGVAPSASGVVMRSRANLLRAASDDDLFRAGQRAGHMFLVTGGEVPWPR